MSSRIISAVSSRQSKQELVRLLFGPKYAGNGPDAHRMLDSSIYSYHDLRKAYLERLQEIHPDKLKHQISRHNCGDTTTALHSQFVELQNAWDKYEEVAKLMQRVGKPQESNFTMFGVGCSFADSPQERARRDEITDQACRGWFSAGLLADGTSEIPMQERDHTPVTLCDDDWFVKPTYETADLNNSEATLQSRSMRSLIPAGYRPKR
jgi:hypothetical protein